MNKLKFLSLVIAILTISVSALAQQETPLPQTQQFTQIEKDSIISLSGHKMIQFGKQTINGYLLLTAGTLTSVIAAATPLKDTKLKTVEPNIPVFIVGGALYLFGVVTLISAPDNAIASGKLLKLISGQKLVIPIKKRK